MRFKQARIIARRAIRAAKNSWFQEKAKEAEKEHFGGKKVWKCIRDMQRGRRGLLPSRTVVIDSENSEPCSSSTSQHQCWRRHFTTVLNVRSQCDATAMDKVRQREVDEDLGSIPIAREVTRAPGKLNNGKAPGSSNVLPEVLKVAMKDGALVLDLVKAVWKDKCVPQEWVDAILIPIPQKGNLCCYDNWWGIALLDVMGKVVARVIQWRLQKLAERVLPESQCGFRRGHGCTDMIFTVRQLTEKAIEHRARQYLIFVDLKKAYDLVPHEVLWVALSKFGVPQLLIDIICSFHENMKARIRAEGELLEEIEVDNGLQQGWTMVFNRAAPWPPHCSTSTHVWWLRVGCAGCVMWREWGHTCSISLTSDSSDGTNACVQV